MGTKLTRKEKGFVKDIVNGEPGVKAILNNYDVKNYNTAGVMAHESLKKPKIQKAIADMLPDDLLREKHLALLNKEEVITKNNVTTGEIDVVPTGQIDVQAVSKGLDMAYKLKGAYAPEKHTNLNLTVELKPEELDRLTKLLNESKTSN